MDVREKLVELLMDSETEDIPNNDGFRVCHLDRYKAEFYADYLIAHGVTVQKDGWIKVYQNVMYPYSCSECGNCHARKVNFCERCGAKLDLPQPPKGE